MREVCDRLGGENAALLTQETRLEKPSTSVEASHTLEEKRSRPRKSFDQSDDGYVKVGKEERIAERRRMGFVG
jgi:hypothetical protein